MVTKRATDTQEGLHFRSDRMVRENDKWFFLTREGTVEGPYASESEAHIHLQDYIKLMKAKALNATEAYSLMPMLQTER